MPTLPSGAPDPAERRPYRHRSVAESFGADTDRYDRARPSYPHAMVARIRAASPGPDLLDVGTGTGIAARLFRAAGCRVLGVDPDPRMAGYARNRGIDTETARFEDWDPAGRTFDTVAAGQTWHWVDPAAGAAKAADVLRPGGRIALFWNADRPHADLATAFGAVYARVLPESLAARRWTAAPAQDGDPAAAVEGYRRLGANAADGLRATGSFDAPEQWLFDWERTYTRDEWLSQVPTTGDHGRYPRERIDELLDGIGAAIDAAGGGFTMPYTTVTVTAARLP